MSDTTNRTKIGVNVIGAAVIVLICTVITLACFALVTAQANIPSAVRPSVAVAVDAGHGVA
jgi:hypothetical protein